MVWKQQHSQKRQEMKLEVTELKFLRSSLGVTRMDGIRQKCIRGTAQVEPDMVWA